MGSTVVADLAWCTKLGDALSLAGAPHFRLLVHHTFTEHRADAQCIALLCREDAVRLGFFIGGFTGSYHLLTAALNKWQGDRPAQNCMVAGTAAGQLTVHPLHIQQTPQVIRYFYYQIMRPATMYSLYHYQSSLQ